MAMSLPLPSTPKRLAIGGTSIDQLDTHLLWKSAEAARYAISNYSSEDRDDTVVSAVRCGMAAEFLLLSTLAGHNPALLSGSGGSPALFSKSRLLLAGTMRAPDLTPANLKTIDVREAYRLVELIHPQLVFHERSFEELLGTRNAAAHLALVERDPLDRAIVTMVTMVEQLLNVAGRNRVHYWTSPLLPLVTTMLDAANTALRRRVQSKLTQAKAAFEAFTARVPPESKESLLVILEGHPARSSGDGFEERRECPVCARLGWLLVFVSKEEESNPTVHRDSDDTEPYVLVNQVGLPYLFDCPVCGLELEDDELTQFPELSTEVEMDPEDVDAREFFK